MKAISKVFYSDIYKKNICYPDIYHSDIDINNLRCTMQVAMGGIPYILYATAGKLLEINVNHFTGHISMDSFGHLSMESLIGNTYRTPRGGP